jgi:hypothetical protein
MGGSMRQPEDTKTIEIFSEGKRGPGRPRSVNPMDSATRQRLSRARRRAGSDGELILSSMVSKDALFALDRMCEYLDVSRQVMLEKLILSAEVNLLAPMTIASPEFDKYFKRDKSQK